MNNYQDQSKQQLLAEIERLKKELKKNKKYGLVWEEKPEEVVEMCKSKLPVLKEVKSKEIITDKNKPVNLLIECDNYQALSVLNYTHAKKVDVIYIDPPYNTGNKDFIFNDRYIDKEDSYRHSKWLSFMEKRLKLAKNLLKDSGVIFISIDDNEMAQLKMLTDNPDLFGENNLIQLLVWHSKYTVSNDAKFFSTQHEYVLCYARNINKAKINLLSRTEEANRRYLNPDNDLRGPWKPTPLHAKSGTESNRYEFVFKNGIRWSPPEGRFPRFNQETLRRLEVENRIWFGKNSKGTPSVKTFLSEVSPGIKAGSLLPWDIFGKLKDERIGLLDPHAVHLSDFKAKADGLRKYIQTENKKGKKIFGGIVANTDSRNYRGRWVYFDRPKEDLTNSFDNWATLEL